MVIFPEFNENTFPLILIKEYGCAVIFNTEQKEYIGEVEIQEPWGFDLCFLDKEFEKHCFITQH